MKHKHIPVIAAILVFLTMPSFHTHAGKIYQWVDEDGKKHFTQTPPPEKKVTKIDLEVSNTSVSPVEKSDGIYCGTLRISYPNRSHSSKKETNRMSGKISSWERSLKQTEERLHTHIQRANKNRTIKNGESVLRNSASYTANKEKLTRKVNEYRCAINWANDQSNPDNANKVKEEYMAAKMDFDTAVKQRDEICGDEPPKYDSYGPKRDAYIKWESCIKKYSDVVRTTQRRLSNARSRYSKIEK